MKGRSASVPNKTRVKPFGAADFIAFIQDWGHPEWVVLTVEAPIEEVSNLYSSMHSSRRPLPNVPIQAARKKDNEIAPLVAVVQSKGNSWAVILRTLCLPIGMEDIKEAEKDAQTLSATLKARALAFFGEDTSFAMSYSLYENGKKIGKKDWECQTDPADAAFCTVTISFPH